MFSVWTLGSTSQYVIFGAKDYTVEFACRKAESKPHVFFI